MLKNLKAVIFDLDGTLIDSVPDLRLQANRLLAEYGRRELTYDEVKNMVGEGVKKFLERAFTATGELPPASEIDGIVTKYKGYYGSADMSNTYLYEGAKEVIDYLKVNGVKIAMVTNKPRIPTHFILKKLNIFDSFDFICAEEDVAEHKPSPFPLLECLKKLCVNIENSLMVGDSPADINAATSGKIPCVAMTYGYSRISYQQLGADYLCESMKDLKIILDK